MLFHMSSIFTISKSQNYEYFDNQEYTTPTQSGRKNCNPSFLGDKNNFIKDKCGNMPLNKDIGKVGLKYYIPLTFS